MASIAPPGSSQSPPFAGVLRRPPGGKTAVRAAAIVDRLMLETAYDRAFTRDLARTARSSRASWELRRVACLALETQFLRIDDEGDLAQFLRALRLLTRRGKRVHRFVLEEGYSTTDVAGFASELRRRVARFEWIHSGLARRDARAAGDFVAHARHECFLTFGRYLFQPREVAREVIARLKITRGLPHMPAVNPFNRDEVKRALALLPRYERAVVELLMRDPIVYWVADSTPSEINSLIEYPIGTVAVVVKPPGSDIEFEIKRTGLRGDRVVDCIFQRPGAGDPLTPLHHYYGGSYGRLLRWELAEGTTLARMFRLAYGGEAPISRIVHLVGVLDVPGPCGNNSLVSYFGRAECYGDGYDTMRKEMESAVPRLENMPLPVPPGDPGGFGLTGKWISVTSPEQAVITNTSSFRIDRLAAYLAPTGAETYFTKGLGVHPSPDDARRAADMLLSEVLPAYVAPPVEYSTWGDYVEAAFAVPENRESADQTYVDVLRQLGEYFGFCCAMRATSAGESFVERNIGLRRVFRGGAWRMETIFMDHDAMVIAGRDYSYCDSEDFLDRAFFDLSHMVGGTIRWRTRGCAGALKAMLRIGPAAAEEGLRALKEGFRERYHAGQNAITRVDELRRMFRVDFVNAMHDWDDTVRSFLAAYRENTPHEKWLRSVARMLRKRGYKAKAIRNFTQTMQEFALLLPWF
ncbi:MAG TPA: hypothetical protein VJZ76_08935, partial [Thermoanaerobaculia bacterium]|nr:hypothetical protein [Thermoanaerobaculia bacterium]